MIQSKYLEPAILYKTEIELNFEKLRYSDQMTYYSGGPWISHPRIDEGHQDDRYWAILNSDKMLVGFISYSIDRYVNSVIRFGLIGFTKDPAVGFACRDLIEYFNTSGIRRMEFRMVSGNPVESAYDGLLKKYGGNKYVLHGVTIDEEGSLRDEAIYEILFDNNSEEVI